MAQYNTGRIQFASDSPLENHTTISDSLKLRVTVVKTAMNSDTDKITGKAVTLEKKAKPNTTSAPICPLAASPSKRTINTLSQTIIRVDNTTPPWLNISEITLRLNKDIDYTHTR